jgi:hypothetical protein
MVDSKSAQHFMDLFRGRTDEYGLRNIETGASWYEGLRDDAGEIMYDADNKRMSPTGLTLKDYQNHLAKTGGMALAIIPNTRTGNVWFGCLDIDKDDIDHEELARRIDNFALPLHVFVSRSGAAHVYIFFDGDGKPAQLVRKMLEEYAAALGCGKDLPKAEIFPNQDQFDESVLGHHITIPLYGCEDADDRRGKFIDAHGQQWGLNGFLDRVEVWPSKRKMPFPVRGESFEQGPPCLETIQRKGGLPDGYRNNGLYNVGVYLKKAYPDEWEERLEAYNRKYLKSPVEKKELLNIIKSLKKKDYKFTCAKDPIASHCEKSVCEKRLYGIRSSEEKIRDEALRIPLPVTALRKYNTVPPAWEMLVGDVWIKVCTKEMMTYANLRSSLLEAMNILPPSMKQSHWDIKLNDLLQFHCTFEDVAEDAGDWKLALDIINNYVANGKMGRENARNDCWLQWVKEKMGSYAHVTTVTIRSHLATFNIQLSVAQVAILMKQSGWNSTTIRIGTNSHLRVWKRWEAGLVPQKQDPNEVGELIDETESGEFVEEIYTEEVK